MADRLLASLHRSRTDSAAFGDVYAAEARRVLVYTARRTLDAEVARDLTAETFAAAFVARARFRGTTDAEVQAWLFGIARNLCRHYVRKGVAERKAIERLGIEVPPMAAEDEQRLLDLAEVAHVREHVAGAYARLPAAQAAAVRLRVLDEMPYSEVARILGVSEQAARVRVSRALARLSATASISESKEVTT